LTRTSGPLQPPTAPLAAAGRAQLVLVRALLLGCYLILIEIGKRFFYRAASVPALTPTPRSPPSRPAAGGQI